MSPTTQATQCPLVTTRGDVGTSSMARRKVRKQRQIEHGTWPSIWSLTSVASLKSRIVSEVLQVQSPSNLTRAKPRELCTSKDMTWNLSLKITRSHKTALRAYIFTSSGTSLTLIIVPTDVVRECKLTLFKCSVQQFESKSPK